MENSELILNFIEKQNVSCYKVAQSTGISESTFSKWKVKPTSKVDLSIVQKIAKYFNTTIDIILDYNQSQRYTSSLSDDELELFCSFNKLSERDKGKVMERAETLAELAAERASKERTAAQAKKTAKPVALVADERITPDEPGAGQPEPTEILSETQVISDEEPRKLVLQLFDLPVSAGTGVILSDNRYEPIEVYWSPEAEQANYVLRVFGNSMEDDFHEGDLVLVESVKDISVGEIGIFVADGEGFIKVKGENALISLNPSYKPKPYSKFSTIQCIGRVLGKAKMV